MREKGSRPGDGKTCRPRVKLLTCRSLTRLSRLVLVQTHKSASSHTLASAVALSRPHPGRHLRPGCRGVLVTAQASEPCEDPCDPHEPTTMIVFPYNVKRSRAAQFRAVRRQVAMPPPCHAACAAYESSPDPWYEPFYKHPKLTILYTSITIHKERSISNDLFDLARARGVNYRRSCMRRSRQHQGRERAPPVRTVLTLPVPQVHSASNWHGGSASRIMNS